jgi:DNA-binding NarL/FixJ family response regulator
VRILVIDDHKLFADAVQVALEKLGLAVTVATTAVDGIEAAIRERPDVVLLDIGLPDRSGLLVGKEILEACPDAKVVVVTSLDDRRALQESVRYGFHGYLTKDTKLPQLVRAIHDAAEGHLVIPQRLATRRVNGESEEVELLVSQLTRKEREVLALLVQGAGSTEIASALVISPNTVRTHIQSILAKLQVHSRLEAVAFASRHNLVSTSGTPTLFDGRSEFVRSS